MPKCLVTVVWYNVGGEKAPDGTRVLYTVIKAAFYLTLWEKLLSMEQSVELRKIFRKLLWKKNN